MPSLAEILCPEHRFATGSNYPLSPGDRVQLGTNRGPLYEVVHIAGETAWVRPLGTGSEGLARVDRLRLAA